MSTIKVNTLDTRSGTDITVTTGKTVVIPAGATVSVAGTQTVTGTSNLSGATLTLPATLPVTSGTNITNIPGANITGTVPLAALGNVDTTGLQDDIALLAFKTQANGSLARYNLVDQSVDSFEDASGVDASGSTNEARNAANYYFGEAAGVPNISGNYDSTAVDGDYTYYKWTTATSSGSFTTDTAQDYEYLVIAGGGGGGGAGDGEVRAGGGGAGGYRTNGAYDFPVAATTISSITVGAGGAGGTGVGPGGAIGSNSVFSTITAAGGGGGGGYSDAADTGGSGGGGGTKASPSWSGAAGNTPSTSPAQGYAGGDGAAYVGNDTTAAGGGGGAGSVGNARSGASGGNGGLGLSSSIDGAATFRASGGGGGAAGPAGAANPGGGGTGGSGNSNGVSGTVNTGGGGGGASHVSGGSTYTGGTGGSGIVIIKRLTGVDVEGANMTLVSTAQTAQAQPTKGDVVLTYTNGTGTTTLDTDLIASVSRDNGTTYTAAPLTLQGTTGGHNIATAHDVVISGQPAGTSMRWKVVTANQSSASKTTRIQAVSLGWS